MARMRREERKRRRKDFAEYFGGKPVKVRTPVQSQYLTPKEIEEFRKKYLPTSEAEESGSSPQAASG